MLLFNLAMADWGEALYELTGADDPAEMLEEDALIFVLYEDRSHPDNSNMLQAFKNIALEHPENPVSAL